MGIDALVKLQRPAVSVLIADVDIHKCHRMIPDTILRVPHKIARRKAQPPAKVTRDTKLPRIAGLGFEVWISIDRRIELRGGRRNKVRTVRSIGMRHRIDVITEADAWAAVTAKRGVAVMADACREFQRRKNAPLILQIEGAVDERTVIDGSKTF